MDKTLIDSLSLKEKFWFAKAIAGMICADEHVDNNELIFLREAISFLPDKGEVNLLVNMVKEKKVKELDSINIDHKKAFSILKNLTKIAIIDDYLSLSETNFLQETGDKLGFPANFTNKLISLARQQIKHSEHRAKLFARDIKEDVTIKDLSVEGCTIFTKKRLTSKATAQIQLIETDFKEDFYITHEAIDGDVVWVRPSKNQPSLFLVKLQFRKKPNLNQGVYQILFPEKFHHDASKELHADKNCLNASYVKCPICNYPKVPRWTLVKNSLVTTQNIFGVTIFKGSNEGFHFCDFNLIQITSCPECSFSSNQNDFFIKSDNKNSPYDWSQFKEVWKKGVKKRKSELSGEGIGYFSENRNLSQAILSYKFAIETHDRLFKTYNNLDEQRKIISLSMILSELTLSSGDRKEAEDLLRKALDKSRAIMMKLKLEGTVRCATLNGLIHVYFREYNDLLKQINFLKDQSNRDLKELKIRNLIENGLSQLEGAYRNKDNYSYDLRKDFRVKN